jgi:nitroreductase
MKGMIKKYVPKGVYKHVRSSMRYIRLSKSYFYDLNHYFNNSMNLENNSNKKLIAKIILDTHVIEKGLTMPEIKIGFGQGRLIVLMNNLLTYFTNYNTCEPQVDHGVAVVKEYFLFHTEKDYGFERPLVNRYDTLISVVENKSINKKNNRQIDMTSNDYFIDAKSEFFKFAQSRSSVRNFSDEPILKETILKALDLSRSTPSACNRQSVRVHLYTDKTEIDKILKIQGGNRGFGHLSQSLILITYDVANYFEQSERNSGFVDGGMYSMNILYSLHASKIAACILNAAHSPAKDVAMREVAKIPNAEVFVAWIACGIPPDDFKIATSFRYPLNHILEEH